MGSSSTPCTAAPDSCCLTALAPTQITGPCPPQPCSVSLELTLCICVNRVPKSSRGKVKKKSLFQLAYENIFLELNFPLLLMPFDACT